MVELRCSRAPRQVGGDCECRPPAKNVIDITAQVSSRADVNEDAQSVPKHGLDGVPEGDWSSPLRDGETANFLSRFRYAGGCRARIDGHSGGMQLKALVECGQRLKNGSEARRVIRTRERQFFADHTRRAE